MIPPRGSRANTDKVSLNAIMSARGPAVLRSTSPAQSSYSAALSKERCESRSRVGREDNEDGNGRDAS
jgi:hypothetical protein